MMSIFTHFVYYFILIRLGHAPSIRLIPLRSIEIGWYGVTIFAYHVILNCRSYEYKTIGTGSLYVLLTKCVIYT